jgi:3-oxoacyl-(acyl-carrier-protein) synthase
VDCVPEAGRAWNGPKVFLSNNSAFGGHNASLALAAGNAECETRTAEPKAKSERILITGCGVVSAVGVGLEALESAWCKGRSGLCPIALPGMTSLPSGRIDEATVEASDRRLNLRQMDRSSKWATVAARLAIRAAQFPEKPAALAELGLFLNLAGGPSWAESEFLTSFLGNDHQVTQLAAFPYIVPGSIAGNVCRALMLSGHNLTLNPGPAAGLFGLEPALAALRCGHAGALLCGAVDELSGRILADSFFAGRISQDLPPGEGAAIFMLETAAHAKARGAQPLAEIRGTASVVNKKLPSAALDEVVTAAVQQAGIGRDDIRVVCFSGANASLPHAAWREMLVQTSAATGWLEGAQPLLDLAVALRLPELKPDDHVLSLAVTPHGLAGAALVRKL